MAQQVTSDANITPVLKNWYTEKRFESLLSRNSPLLQKIEKNRVGGATYNFAALYGYGGACSADWTVAIAQASSQARNVQFSVPPGYLFSVFNISVVEKFASRDEKGAYVKLVVDKMFAATEALRKQFAAALYASGYGEFCQLPTGTYGASDTTITLPDDAIMKIDIGTVFDCTTGQAPSGTLSADGPFTVTAINGNVVTFTRTGTSVAMATGEWLEYHGGSSGATAPSYPTGLAGWIPSLYNRTGSSWDTYIGTAFYGVTRSTNTGRLAGWFYQRDSANNELYSSAISNGVRLVRRAGGIPKIIAINDDDYMSIQNELQSFRNYWQSVDIRDPAGGPQFVYGIEALKFAFSSSYIEEVYDDPYCPKGTAYILDTDTIEFAALTNPAKPDNGGITGNNPGAPKVDGEADPTENPFQLNIEDFLNIQPATNTATGPAAQVTLMLMGNFAFHNPAHCAVVVF